MKIIRSISLTLAVLAMAVMPLKAQVTYTGPGTTDGGAAADGGAISSVVVGNDADNITFTVNSSQSMASYIFYAIELQITGKASSGDTSLVNPWGPHVGISTGVNSLINTWGTGASALTYSSGSWTQNASASYNAGGTGYTYATMTFSLTSLGLSVGDSFNFDVVSTYTSGTQSAYGALASTGYPAESDSSWQPWSGSNYYDSATDASSTFNTGATLYTVTAVPEPATLALLGAGGVLLLAVRRNRVQRS